MLESLMSKHVRNVSAAARHIQNFTTVTKPAGETAAKLKMKGWQIHAYGSLDELQLANNLRIPIIKNPTDCLVKVDAAGVNPLDVAMVGGYGSNLINLMRCNRSSIEFPLTLGREFSGTLAQKGFGLCNDLKVGDKVWGVVPVHLNGSHAEYVVVPEFCLSKRPADLQPHEAGSVLYAGLTAWSGLFLSGELGGICGAVGSSGGGKGKRVLVLGASGGVGSIAVQILKAEGAIVFATCSTSAVPIVQSLGADCIVDYTKPEQLAELSSYGTFDIVLDCAGQGPEYAEKLSWTFKNFVTFSSPLLKNIDESGLGVGMIKNLTNLIESNAKSLTTRQGLVKWGYFVPAPQGIKYLKQLVERKKLLPLIDSVYSLDNAIDAYKKVEDGHLRGKVVIDFEKECDAADSKNNENDANRVS